MFMIVFMAVSIAVAVFAPAPRQLRIFTLSSMMGAALAGILYVIYASALFRVLVYSFMLSALGGVYIIGYKSWRAWTVSTRRR